MHDDELSGYLANNCIKWRFNLEKSPWWGGVFERMIGTVKRALRTILGKAKLTYDELLTNLIEIEGTINSRPLTYEYDEVGVEVLTPPSHIIFGYRLQSPRRLTMMRQTRLKGIARGIGFWEG